MTRSQHRDFRRNETPFTQLDAELTDAEADGSLAREVGMIGRRVHQPGKRYFAERAADPTSIHFVHPWPDQQGPNPRPQSRPVQARHHHPLAKPRRSA